MKLIPLRGVPSASLSPCTPPVAAFAKEGAAHVSTQECGVRKAGLGRLVGVQGEHREGKEAGCAPEPCPRGFGRGRSRAGKQMLVQVGASHEAGMPPPCGSHGSLGARKPLWTRGGLWCALAKAGNLAFALGRRWMR